MPGLYRTQVSVSVHAVSSLTLARARPFPVYHTVWQQHQLLLSQTRLRRLGGVRSFGFSIRTGNHGRLWTREP